MRFKPSVSPDDNSRLISDPNVSIQSRWEYKPSKADEVRYTPLQMAVQDADSPRVFDRLATLQTANHEMRSDVQN